MKLKLFLTFLPLTVMCNTGNTSDVENKEYQETYDKEEQNYEIIKEFIIFLIENGLKNTTINNNSNNPIIDNKQNINDDLSDSKYEQNYSIAKNFISLYLESYHQNTPDIEEDPKITEFKIALELFGNYSKKGDYISMNRIVIWLEKNIEKFKSDFCKEDLEKTVYYPVLNEIGLSCAIPGIVYSQTISKKQSLEEDVESKINLVHKVLIKFMKLLVNNGTDINHTVSAKNWVGKDSEWNKINGNLLHIASSTERDELVTILISILKAKPNLKDTNNRSALYIAIQNCKNDQSCHIIEALLENGADTNLECSGIKPLKLTISKGLMNVANLLIQKGADQKILQSTTSSNSSFFGFLIN